MQQHQRITGTVQLIVHIYAVHAGILTHRSGLRCVSCHNCKLTAVKIEHLQKCPVYADRAFYIFLVGAENYSLSLSLSLSSSLLLSVPSSSQPSQCLWIASTRGKRNDAPALTRPL